MTESNLAAALAKFHKAVGTIHKTARAQYGNFADLAAVLSAISGPLSDAGLAVTQTFIPTEGATLLRTTLHHTSGQTVDSDVPIIEAPSRGNPLHAWGGAVTYQRRFALLAILNLAAGIEDDDGDHADAKPQPKATPKKSASPAPAPQKAAKAEPSTTKPAVEPPLSAEDRDVVLELLKDKQKNEAKRFAEFLPAFRKEFGLAAEAPVAKAIQEQKHVEFATAFFA